ncbi:MAG: YlxR family protein [Anaerovoracaceae bacterium]
MKTVKKPMRKCIGCNESYPKEQLIRIANYEGNVTVDITGKAKGRGVYICKNSECLGKAIKRKAFVRAFGQEVSEEQKEQLDKEIKSHEES